MARYRVYGFDDNELIQADTVNEIVTQMAGYKLEQAPNLLRFRRGVAKRVKAMFKVKIRTRNNMEFVADLMECGLIEEVKG